MAEEAGNQMNEMIANNQRHDLEREKKKQKVVGTVMRVNSQMSDLRASTHSASKQNPATAQVNLNNQQQKAQQVKNSVEKQNKMGNAVRQLIKVPQTSTVNLQTASPT